MRNTRGEQNEYQLYQIGYCKYHYKDFKYLHPFKTNALKNAEARNAIKGNQNNINMNIFN